MDLNIRIISAGAGSGKTYRLTQEMFGLLKGKVRASGIIATTFTKKAATELQERVRIKLLEEGLSQEADDLSNALIGTVHSLGVKLLKRFAFEAGVSPAVDIIAEEDHQLMFNQALATVLTAERIGQMELFSNRLGLNKNERYDWRKEVKLLTDVARANDFSTEVLEISKIKSFESFKEHLIAETERDSKSFHEKFLLLLESTLERLQANEDSTQVTAKAVNTLKSMRNELKLRGSLHWHQWVKLAKLKVGAKSKEAIEELIELAWLHESLPEFQKDIELFIHQIFDIAIAALREYEDYKKSRGLIDYIDMEIQVKRLLDHPQVKKVLSQELDLLMVDEFQDTNPIQLEIFLKLARLAKHSIWVGDPKQSIYGFRGADPRLMQEIIKQSGGVKAQDILGFSWRSREDIVLAVNSLFTKAFDQLPVEQIALKPKRGSLLVPESDNSQTQALIHYHFQFEGEGRKITNKEWMNRCLAHSVKELLDSPTYVQPKAQNTCRPAIPGDIAILCRSNYECQEMAGALHRLGIKAAISRSGLLHTAEARLILACLKFILNDGDSLSVAEILLLADEQKIEEIIDDRLQFLESIQDKLEERNWAKDNTFIARLASLRSDVAELSSTEILNLLLTELDLYRIIMSWGNVRQRMDNVDVLRKLALQYEEACARLHVAASLGGYLLWLNDQESKQKDMQGSGEGGDAVNVLTYHKSKGLEWPIVFCHSLEGKIRDKVWGLFIVLESEEVDLDDILGKRWLRYWVNPYSDQSKKTPLQERIDNSEAKRTAHQEALMEEARLLYVGMTRARDYLVFPTRQKPTLWLNRVWHQGREDFPTLDENSHESPWSWDEHFLLKRTEIRKFSRDFPISAMEEGKIITLESHAGKQFYPPFMIDLKKEGFSQEIAGTTGALFQYGTTIAPSENTSDYQLAKVLKAFLIADHLEYGSEERMEMAQQLVLRFELHDQMEANELIHFSDGFYSFIKKHFAADQILRKFPIQYLHEGRLFDTLVDFILIRPEKILLIQNSGFSGEQKKWRQKAAELMDWMHFSKLALQELFPAKEIQSFLHFVLGGGMIEINTRDVRSHQLDKISKTLN